MFTRNDFLCPAYSNLIGVVNCSAGRIACKCVVGLHACPTECFTNYLGLTATVHFTGSEERLFSESFCNTTLLARATTANNVKQQQHGFLMEPEPRAEYSALH